jgi:hypothetical protein
MVRFGSMKLTLKNQEMSTNHILLGKFNLEILLANQKESHFNQCLKMIRRRKSFALKRVNSVCPKGGNVLYGAAKDGKLDRSKKWEEKAADEDG